MHVPKCEVNNGHWKLMVKVPVYFSEQNPRPLLCEGASRLEHVLLSRMSWAWEHLHAAGSATLLLPMKPSLWHCRPREEVDGGGGVLPG